MRLKNLIICFLVVGAASQSWSQSTTSIMVPALTLGDPSQSIDLLVSVNTTETIGFLQFTLEFDSTIVAFTSVTLDSTMPNGFGITGIVPNLGPPYTSSPPSNTNVLVQISGNGVTHSFTGNQAVAVMKFTFKAGACGSSPMNFTAICQRTHLATLGLLAICDPVRIDGIVATNCATDAPSSRTLDHVRLLPNMPNPFNPSTQIRFQLPESGPVLVRVFNVRWKIVRLLMDSEASGGLNTIVWNGRDDLGRALASGVYHCQIKTPREAASRSMLLLK